MKNLDNQLREIFSQKLSGHESAVRPELWNAVQSKLAAQAAGSASTVATVAKVGINKLWWAAASAVIVGGGIATVVLLSNDATDSLLSVETTTEINQVIPLPASNSQEEIAPVHRGTLYTEPVAIPDTEIRDDEPRVVSNDFVNDLPVIATDEPADLQLTTITPNYSDNGGQKSQMIQPNAVATIGMPIGVPNTEESRNAQFNYVIVSEKDLRYFFIPQNDKGATYNWSFGDGTTSDEMSPAHSFDEEGSYTVTCDISNATGNSSNYSLQLQAYRPAELLIPNVFTPNADGNNDTFEVVLKNTSTEITKIIVLNDKGKVFESDGSEMWNGQLPSGDAAPDGPYTYLVRAKNRNQVLIEKTGTVQLKRD